jgi:hypothetical protein
MKAQTVADCPDVLDDRPLVSKPNFGRNVATHGSVRSPSAAWFAGTGTTRAIGSNP